MALANGLWLKYLKERRSPSCPAVCGASRFAAAGFLTGFGRDPELARSNGAQLLAQGRCALATERRLELHLRFGPQLPRNAKPLGTCLGQVQLLAAAIQGPVLYADEPVALQRQHGPSEGGSIHDKLAGKCVDRQRPQPFQL